MPATPADIARYTTNGILVTSPVDPAVSNAIVTDHIDARSGADREIEMFFDSPAHAQIMLDERFDRLSIVNPTHLGIEMAETLDLGGDVPIAPAVPKVRVLDDLNGLDATPRVRAYAQDAGSDRFSVEVLA